MNKLDALVAVVGIVLLFILAFRGCSVLSYKDCTERASDVGQCKDLAP